MLDFIKRAFNKKKPSTDDEDNNNISAKASKDAPTEESAGLFTRLKASLARTSKNFTEKIYSLVAGKKELDEELLDELENILLGADVGFEISEQVLEHLVEKLGRKELSDSQVVMDSLKEKLFELIKEYEKPLELSEKKPLIILMVGVNGAGKTTSIGKLANYFKKQDKKVLLAAGDTFRAAAVEQLKVWGERNDIPVVAQETGSDSSSVIYDAYQSACAKNYDVLIADTAGRLHTKHNLMEELSKINKTISKLQQEKNTQHEVILALDATIGQNAIEQAKHFNKTIKIDSLIVNKLDGTAKGGVIFAITNQLQLPIRFIGLGEKIDDLKEFKAKEFIEALFEI